MSIRRRRAVNREKFQQAKRIRRAVIGEYCECDCGNRSTLGHHRAGLSNNEWWHIALKCASCETLAHQQDKNGNPEWQMRLIRKNDRIIAEALGLPRVPAP